MKSVKILGLMFAILLLSLMFATATFAEESQTEEPLDPDANACFDGGSLEGQCHTEEDWAAGYFLARYEHDMLDLTTFPSEYKWALPRDEGNIDDHDEDDADGHNEEICTDPYYGDQPADHSEG